MHLRRAKFAPFKDILKPSLRQACQSRKTLFDKVAEVKMIDEIEGMEVENLNSVIKLLANVTDSKQLKQLSAILDQLVFFTEGFPTEMTIPLGMSINLTV